MTCAAQEIRKVFQIQTFFYAVYEDTAKAKAAAIKEGFTGADGESWNDFIEASDFRTGQAFASLNESVDWLKAEIAAGRTFYGCGDILERERIKQRCDYCICNGIQTVRRFVVDDGGISFEEAHDSECC